MIKILSYEEWCEKRKKDAKHNRKLTDEYKILKRTRNNEKGQEYWKSRIKNK